MEICSADILLLSITTYFENYDKYNSYFRNFNNNLLILNEKINKKILRDNINLKVIFYTYLEKYFNNSLDLEEYNCFFYISNTLLNNDTILEESIKAKNLVLNYVYEYKDSIIQLIINYNITLKIIINPLLQVGAGYSFKNTDECIIMINPYNDINKKYDTLLLLFHEISHLLVREYYLELTIAKLYLKNKLSNLKISNYIQEKYLDDFIISEEILVSPLSVALYENIIGIDVEQLKNKERHIYGKTIFDIIYKHFEKYRYDSLYNNYIKLFLKNIIKIEL